MKKGLFMQIIPPKQCPSCDSTLVWKNDQLYCMNKSCGSKVKKSIEHWAKVLKIKGLGPATIDKLELSSVLDIYDLEIEYMKVALGSEKLAIKLLSEIEKSKLAPLNSILPAFGVPLIGNSATQKLSLVIESLFDLTSNKAKEAGLGPKATENLMTWFENEFLPVLSKNLPHSFKFTKRDIRPKESKGTICITGKLKSFKTKAEAESVLQSLGYEVKKSLTKDVTILINEGGVESTKTKKARLAGVTIVDNLKDLIGE